MKIIVSFEKIKKIPNGEALLQTFKEDFPWVIVSKNAFFFIVGIRHIAFDLNKAPNIQALGDAMKAIPGRQMA